MNHNSTSSSNSIRPQVGELGGRDDDSKRIEMMMGLLDSEIDGIRSDQTRQGWTSWIILTALAGTLWSILGTLENTDIKPSNYLRVYLSLSLLIDILYFVLVLLFWRPTSNFATDRFRWASFVANRFVMLLQILRSVAFISIVLVFNSNVWWPQISSVIVFYGFLGLFYLLYLIMDIIRQPLQITPGVFSGRVALTGLILILIGVWGLLGISTPLFSSGDLTINEVRLGSLLWVATILIFKFAQTVGEPPLLASLIDARRALSLGEIDCKTAVYQVDIALRGMRVADVLQGEISSHLAAYGEIQRECHFIFCEIEALRSSLSAEGKPLNEKELMLATTVYKSTAERYRMIISILEKLGEMNKKLLKRLRDIPKGSPKVEKDIVDLINALSMEQKKLYSQVEEIESILEGLDERIARNLAVPQKEDRLSGESVMARLRKIRISASPDFSMKANLYDIEDSNAE